MSHRWTICAPMRMEVSALRRGLEITTRGAIHRTGVGRGRAARAAWTAPVRDAEALAAAGAGGALDRSLRAGDVIVATEVRADPLTAGVVPPTVRLPAAPMLAAAIRRYGPSVRTGPVVSTDRLVDDTARERLATTGALVADLETAWLLQRSTGQPSPTHRPQVCVRVVADTGPLLRPATLGQFRTALRILPQVAGALVEWAAATTVRQVLLAAPRSFCAGVERAIAVVEQALERSGPPVYVRKQIVHNAHVVADLQARGAVFVDDLSEVPEGALTVFSAHGVSPAVREVAEDRGLSVIDATCPLVTKVHAEARRFSARGDTVLLIGHAGHEETEGTLGEAPERIRLVGSLADAEQVDVEDPEHVSYLVQTTLAVDDAADIVAALRRRFPALAAPPSDDICYATTNRQRALQSVATDSDVVLVLGSGNSSNSRRLVEVAERCGTPAHLVDDVGDVDLRWLAGAKTVGVTAGASAPPRLVEEMVAALGGLGAETTTEYREIAEDVHFNLPKEVR